MQNLTNQSTYVIKVDPKKSIYKATALCRILILKVKTLHLAGITLLRRCTCKLLQTPWTSNRRYLIMF